MLVSPVQDNQLLKESPTAKPKVIVHTQAAALIEAHHGSSNELGEHKNESAKRTRTISLPSVPHQSRVEHTDVGSQQSEQVLNEASTAKLVHQKVTKPSVAYTREVLNTMSTLEATMVQFYFPKNPRKARAILEYMYQCEGVAFATVDRETRTQLTILSSTQENSEDRSQLLRVVNQDLSKHEQQLLTLYAAKDVPVRVFPFSFDYNLASLIANELAQHHDAVGLKQFHAEYKLSSGQLRLTNIRVNGRNLDQSWLLSVRACVS